MNTAMATSSISQTDGTVVQGVTSFEALYHQHKRKVYSLCLRMLGNPTDAEDLTQEVFLQVYRKLDSFRGESSFSTWLHRLTVNTVLMHFRRQRARPEEPVEDVELHKLIQQDPAAKSQTERSLINRIALRDAIARLPKGYRTVLLLHDVQGYEHEEIGRRLGVTGGTTKSQLHKARAKLRHILRKPPRPGTVAHSSRHRGISDELIDGDFASDHLGPLSTVAA